MIVEYSLAEYVGEPLLKSDNNKRRQANINHCYN